MTLPQLPGGAHLHRKHFQSHPGSINRDASYIRGEADRYSSASSARCRCQRNRELTAKVIDLLQQRYPVDPPAWVQRVVDRLLIDQEALSAMTAEVWS